MSQRSDDLYLVDLIESAEALEHLLRDREFVSFAADDTLRSAVLWKLYIVSEASTRLSSDSRERLASIPWHELRGFLQPTRPWLFHAQLGAHLGNRQIQRAGPKSTG